MLILASTITGCVSFFSFSSSVCVPVGITSSAVGKKVLQSLQESKSISNSITLIDSYISHDEFVSVNHLLREHNEMKEEIKISL